MSAFTLVAPGLESSSRPIVPLSTSRKPSCSLSASSAAFEWKRLASGVSSRLLTLSSAPTSLIRGRFPLSEPSDCLEVPVLPVLIGTTARLDVIMCSRSACVGWPSPASHSPVSSMRRPSAPSRSLELCATDLLLLLLPSCFESLLPCRA